MSTKYYVRTPQVPTTKQVKTTTSPTSSATKSRLTPHANSFSHNEVPKPVSASRPSSNSVTENHKMASRTVGGTTVGGTKIATLGPRPVPQSQARAPVNPTNAMKSASTNPKGPTTARGPSSGSRPDLVPCRTCQRSFAPDRIAAHSEICAKTIRKKRKPFDATKHRVQGTEMEPYTRKGRPTQPPPSLLKSNWRRKHEEFIANIRAAKQAQAHVAKGGKLSDLPPPPPSDTSDYIQCPHCSRKFNQAAAERHIPKCATMLHNKPKPTTVNQASKARTTASKRY